MEVVHKVQLLRNVSFSKIRSYTAGSPLWICVKCYPTVSTALNKEQSFWLSSLWLHCSTTWWQSTSIRLPLTSKSWLQVTPVLLVNYFLRYPLHHMFTIFRTLWQVPKLYPKPFKHYNKYNRCLSSRRPAGSLCWKKPGARWVICLGCG